MISNGLMNIGHEISERMLSPREKVRIGAALIFAVIKFQEKIKNGHKPRNDGFFNDIPSDRPAFEEIIEGVLLADPKRI